mmetsp:Transcript_109950/g.173207  ORF Transcript_109950/g.173207 Transcript_109950/m.173207 type:complete len:208 (+) Transcript_109950:95-718(+)
MGQIWCKRLLRILPGRAANDIADSHREGLTENLRAGRTDCAVVKAATNSDKRINSVSSNDCGQSSADDPRLWKWEWHDDNSWRPHSMEDSHRLNAFYGMSNKQSGFEACLGDTRQLHIIDFSKMEQTNIKTGDIVTIRRIPRNLVSRQTTASIANSLSRQSTTTCAAISEAEEEEEDAGSSMSFSGGNPSSVNSGATDSGNAVSAIV